MEQDIMEALKERFSVHADIEVKGRPYHVALDELPIALHNPITEKYEAYETMIFPIDKKGQVNYGRSMLEERYETREEAVTRLTSIAQDLKKGYDFSEIVPQGLKINVVDRDMSFEGLKLKEGDVIVRNAADKALYIGKANKEDFKDFVLVDKDKESLNYMSKELHVYPYLMEGYKKVISEDGKELWKAELMQRENSPARAMFDAAYEEHTRSLATKARKQILMDKEHDYIQSEKPIAFTRKVSQDEIVVDRYIPTKKMGVYTHEEEVHKNKQLWKKVRKEPVNMTWDKFKERATQEIQNIKTAKSMGLLYYPENTTYMFTPRMREFEKESSRHSLSETRRKELQASKAPKKRSGIHRKSGNRGMEI